MEKLSSEVKDGTQLNKYVYRIEEVGEYLGNSCPKCRVNVRESLNVTHVSSVRYVRVSHV